MTLKVLIVDDEYPARKELRYLLSKFENVEVVGEAASSKEALELIKALSYTIVFLDIEMPGANGLELSRRIKEFEKPPLIVFTTAHEEFALDAFQVEAADYLLKPISEQRLNQALDKISQLLQLKKTKQESVKKAPKKDSLGVIPIETSEKTILLEQDKIYYATASNDYTYIKTFKEKYLTRFTLKELEKRLNQEIFFRCHRSYILNVQKAKEIVPLYNGTLIIVVDDHEGSEVPVSRSQVKSLREKLGI